jgi:hypothetical protein
MKLSAESFRELATALGSTMEGAENERRRSTRVQVHTRVPMSLVEKDEQLPPVPIMVHDVSPRGINILYPKCLIAGQQFTVRLGGPKGFHMLCTVMHVHAQDNGLYSIGAEFTCVLPKNGPASLNDPAVLERIRRSMMG